MKMITRSAADCRGSFPAENVPISRKKVCFQGRGGGDARGLTVHGLEGDRRPCVRLHHVELLHYLGALHVSSASRKKSTDLKIQS